MNKVAKGKVIRRSTYDEESSYSARHGIIFMLIAYHINTKVKFKITRTYLGWYGLSMLHCRVARPVKL